MKKIMIMLTLITSLSSVSANALEVSSVAALGISAVWGGLMSAAAVSNGESSNNKVAVINAVNSDVQKFYQAGEVSMQLKQAIEIVKADNNTVSEAEAVDMILEIVNE